MDKEKLISLNHQYLWHPFTQMQGWIKEIPLIIERGDGNYLIDMDGKRYIDGVSSLWTNIHGHNRREISDAIKEQLDLIEHTTMLGLANIPATLLAEKLVEVAPGQLKKVFYSDSGSTAAEIALKMAYQYWQQKDKPEPSKRSFIKLKGGYHGDTVGSVSIGGIDLFHKIFSHLLFDTYSIPTPFLYHSEFTSGEECKDYSIQCLKAILEKHHHEIAGLFIEPYVQGAAGMIVFPTGFMKKVESLCHEYNILFIVDEVATGFGRTGRLFACEEDQLKPDIMAAAKGISGGYLPLAATLTTDEIYNAFLGGYNEYKTFYHGHSYTGNPLACSAALASLRIFNKDRTLDHLQAKISFLKDSLKAFQDLDHVGDIRQKGMMVGIELVSDRDSKAPYPPEYRVGHEVCMEARNHHIIIRPLGDVVILMPPLSITVEELQALTKGIYQSILTVTERLRK